MTEVIPIDATKTHGILRAQARRDDRAAMHTLLKPIPAVIANNIRTALAIGRPFEGMRHDPTTSAAFWIAADNERVQITTFRPATFEQAAHMWKLIEEAERVDVETTRRVFLEATGIDVQIID